MTPRDAFDILESHHGSRADERAASSRRRSASCRRRFRSRKLPRRRSASAPPSRARSGGCAAASRQDHRHRSERGGGIARLLRVSASATARLRARRRQMRRRSVSIAAATDAGFICTAAFRSRGQRTLDLLNAGDTRDDVARSRREVEFLRARRCARLHESLRRGRAHCRRNGQDSRAGPRAGKYAADRDQEDRRCAAIAFGNSRHPLDGVRVLDLTRVLAGPACGRTLASYGADVLNVRAERLDTIEMFDLDTGQGKRSTFLDLVKPARCGRRCARLVRDAHVFVDSYRPGALAKLGFTPASLAHIARGITYVSVSCYGNEGPWAQRRGWEQLAQGSDRARA